MKSDDDVVKSFGIDDPIWSHSNSGKTRHRIFTLICSNIYYTLYKPFICWVVKCIKESVTVALVLPGIK